MRGGYLQVSFCSINFRIAHAAASWLYFTVLLGMDFLILSRLSTVTSFHCFIPLFWMEYCCEFLHQLLIEKISFEEAARLKLLLKHHSCQTSTEWFLPTFWEHLCVTGMGLLTICLHCYFKPGPSVPIALKYLFISMFTISDYFGIIEKYFNVS